MRRTHRPHCRKYRGRSWMPRRVRSTARSALRVVGRGRQHGLGNPRLSRRPRAVAAIAASAMAGFPAQCGVDSSALLGAKHGRAGRSLPARCPTLLTARSRNSNPPDAFGSWSPKTSMACTNAQAARAVIELHGNVEPGGLPGLRRRVFAGGDSTQARAGERRFPRFGRLGGAGWRRGPRVLLHRYISRAELHPVRWCPEARRCVLRRERAAAASWTLPRARSSAPMPCSSSDRR